MESSQREIVNLQKTIEAMREEMRKEAVEKAKLVQYKQTKGKRLEDLESKAREFEVMANINMPKIVGMLEAKEKQIGALISKDKLNEA